MGNVNSSSDDLDLHKMKRNARASVNRRKSKTTDDLDTSTKMASSLSGSHRRELLSKDEMAYAMTHNMSPDEILMALEKFAREDNVETGLECWQAMKEKSQNKKKIRRVKSSSSDRARRPKPVMNSAA